MAFGDDDDEFSPKKKRRKVTTHFVKPTVGAKFRGVDATQVQKVCAICSVPVFTSILCYKQI